MCIGNAARMRTSRCSAARAAGASSSTGCTGCWPTTRATTAAASSPTGSSSPPAACAAATICPANSGSPRAVHARMRTTINRHSPMQSVLENESAVREIESH